jgi:hypothetical protein
VQALVGNTWTNIVRLEHVATSSIDLGAIM